MGSAAEGGGYLLKAITPMANMLRSGTFYQRRSYLGLEGRSYRMDSKNAKPK